MDPDTLWERITSSESPTYCTYNLFQPVGHRANMIHGLGQIPNRCFAHQHQAYAAPSRGKKQNGQLELDWIPHRPVPCRLCEVKNCEFQDQIDASGNQVFLPSPPLKIGEQLVAFSTPNARDPESCIPSAELHVCSQEQFRCLVTSDGLHGSWRFDGRLSPDGNQSKW